MAGGLGPRVVVVGCEREGCAMCVLAQRSLRDGGQEEGLVCPDCGMEGRVDQVDGDNAFVQTGMGLAAIGDLITDLLGDDIVVQVTAE